MVKRWLSAVGTIFACGTALFADGYSNGIIGQVNTILRRLHPDDLRANNYSQKLNSLAFAGTIVGMLGFGYLSDKIIGRKSAMMAATTIIALFSLLSAGAWGAGGSISGMLAALCAYRFLIGIGIGAEYPSGSVAASEQSEEPGIARNKQHMWFALATNTSIDFGFVMAAFVPLVLLWICHEDGLETVWRLSFGLGVIPALGTLIWRIGMDEPLRFKEDSMKNTKIPYRLIIKRYWPDMVAISTAWFIYDFITYPFGLYSSTVIDAVTGGSDSLYVILGWNVVINLFYMPGTIVGSFIVDRLGPRNSMVLGLVLQAIFGFIMSALYSRLKQNVAAFAVLYGIFLSFGELGPGVSLGLIASKTSPTAVRGQYYGVVAAIGKIGAFTGTWVFPPMIEAFGGPSSDLGTTGPFWVGSGLAVFSAIITFFFVKPLTHDGMKAEDAAFREYLLAHGYDISQMGNVEVEDEASKSGSNGIALRDEKDDKHEHETRSSAA